MLTDLIIRDLARIARANLSFGPGLNVLSGESGSGKSLVLAALRLALGARASQDMIRSGRSEARVEARFVIDRPDLAAALDGIGIPDVAGASPAEPAELVITRTLAPKGRGKVSVNGALFTVPLLARLGDLLVEQMGQHESVALLRPERQRRLLDDLASAGALRARFAAGRRVLAERLAALAAHAVEAPRLERERERLAFERDELAALAPVPGELEALEKEHELLRAADRVRAGLEAAFEEAYDAEDSAIARLDRAERAVRPFAALAPALEAASAALDAALVQAREAADRVRDALGATSCDADRLARVEERLSRFREIGLRHGLRAVDLAVRLAETEARLAQIGASGARKAALERSVDEARHALREIGGELSRVRGAAAESLGSRVRGGLESLGLPGAEIVVRVGPIAAEPRAEDDALEGGSVAADAALPPSLQAEFPSPDGLDEVEMLFAADKGEPLHPLRKVASGGELARAFLALAVELAGTLSVPLVIFDEVDQNVGGRLGTVIGSKLREVARGRQVLCVTHLPQVASFADNHTRVVKEEREGRSTTTCEAVSGEARLREIAHMLRGDAASPVTFEQAREMVEEARKS